MSQSWESPSAGGPSVVVVGGGPSATYFLRWMAAMLCDRRVPNLPAMTIVERGQHFGAGWVYSPEIALPIHTLAANELRSRIDKGEELARGFDEHVLALRRLGVRSVTAGGKSPISPTAGDLSSAPDHDECSTRSISCYAPGIGEGRITTPFQMWCLPWPAGELQSRVEGSSVL